MDIVKNEICKLLTKRTVLILLFLLVLNPVLGLYTMNTINDDGYTGKDYSALYGEISNYSREEVLPEIEQRQMTAEAYGRISLCSRVYKEVGACLSYDEYLDSVNEKADEISIMNKFSGNGGFAEKNAAKTSRVYSKLKGTVPEVIDASGLLNITDNELTDYVRRIASLDYNGKEALHRMVRSTVEGVSKDAQAQAMLSLYKREPACIA